MFLKNAKGSNRVNYTEAGLGEVIYQSVQDAPNKAPVIHFAALGVVLLFGCSPLRLLSTQAMTNASVICD